MSEEKYRKVLAPICSKGHEGTTICKECHKESLIMQKVKIIELLNKYVPSGCPTCRFHYNNVKKRIEAL